MPFVSIESLYNYLLVVNVLNLNIFHSCFVFWSNSKSYFFHTPRFNFYWKVDILCSFKVLDDTAFFIPNRNC